MSGPEFLEADVVLFLHDQALREYGGVQGVKDEGMLHSALGRPGNKLAYADAGVPDLFDLAAAYAYGLAANHPFNDGNKRTAWGCCVLFLKAANSTRWWAEIPRHRGHSFHGMMGTDSTGSWAP